MVFSRNRPPRHGWEAFIRSADEVTLDVDWGEFIRSVDEIN
jgi:hypothetical protein